MRACMLACMELKKKVSRRQSEQQKRGKRVSRERLPGGKTVEVDNTGERDRDVSKTVKQNYHKMADWRRQDVQQENSKRDVVSQGKTRKARVFMGVSSITKVNKVVNRAEDIAVCLQGEK